MILFLAVSSFVLMFLGYIKFMNLTSKTIDSNYLELNDILKDRVPENILEELIELDVGLYYVYNYQHEEYLNMRMFEEETGESSEINVLQLNYDITCEFLNIKGINTGRYLLTGKKYYSTRKGAIKKFKKIKPCLDNLIWQRIYKFKNERGVWTVPKSSQKDTD
jgi:hypothetical protein